MRDEAEFIKALADRPELNAEILFSENSVPTERQNVETLIALGADIIIIAAVDGSAAASAAEFAEANGARVIAYERLIMGTEAVDYYVTGCSIQVGENMAQHLVDNATGTGNPLYIYAGDAGDNNAFLLIEGSWNILQPKIADGTFYIVNSSAAIALQDKPTLTREEMATIIDQVSTNWSHIDARNLAEAHLTAAGSADKGDVFILAPNDGTSLSISDAFNLDPEVTSHFITGQDADVASIQAIIDGGRQTQTVFRDIPDLVRVAMLAVDAIIAGQTPAVDTTFNNGVFDVPTILMNLISIDRGNVIREIVDANIYPDQNFDTSALD
jgi:putative multiple sugar transport system substrate-binding protein